MAKRHYQVLHFDTLPLEGPWLPLRAFLDKTPPCRAAFLAYGGTEILKLGERLWAVPLAAVLE